MFVPILIGILTICFCHFLTRWAIHRRRKEILEERALEGKLDPAVKLLEGSHVSRNQLEQIIAPAEPHRSSSNPSTSNTILETERLLPETPNSDNSVVTTPQTKHRAPVVLVSTCPSTQLASPETGTTPVRLDFSPGVHSITDVDAQSSQKEVDGRPTDAKVGGRSSTSSKVYPEGQEGEQPCHASDMVGSAETAVPTDGTGQKMGLQRKKGAWFGWLG